MTGLTGEPSRPMAVDLTGAAAAAVVVLEREQWTLKSSGSSPTCNVCGFLRVKLSIYSDR
jgi:hypothetical protein